KKFNTYFQEQEPWKQIKENKKDAENTLANLAYMIKDLAILLYPIMPDVSKKIYSFLKLQKSPTYEDFNIELNEITNTEPLFKKIEDKQLEELQTTYSGTVDLDLTVGKI